MGLFDKFKQRHFDAAINAIKTNDIDRFNFAYQKLDDTTRTQWLDHDLNEETPALLLLALEYRHPDLVKRLIGLGADPNQVEAPLLSMALRHPEQQLPLLTELLKGRAKPKPDETLVLDCFTYTSEGQWLLFINRLAQFGIDVLLPTADGDTALNKALEHDKRDLVAFLINSGAELPEPLPDTLSDDLKTYAKRLVEDRKIRQMFLA